jgi:hypothetical protein
MSDCEFHGSCQRQFAAIEKRVDEVAADVSAIDKRVQSQGESIAALRAQVAMWAALGALAGGAVVSVAVNLITKAGG